MLTLTLMHGLGAAASGCHAQQPHMHRLLEAGAVGGEVGQEQGAHLLDHRVGEAVVGEGGAHHAMLEVVKAGEVPRHGEAALGQRLP
jgi:hypothetical protein